MDVAKQGKSHRSGGSEMRDSDLTQANSRKEIYHNKQTKKKTLWEMVEIQVCAA